VDGPPYVDGAASSRIRDLAAQYPSQWRKASSLEDKVAKESLLTKDFSGVFGKLFHQRRRLADGELLFFVNSSLEESARATVSVDGRSITRFDALSGDIAPYPAKRENGRLMFSVELPPSGSLLVAAVNSGTPAPTTPVGGGEQRIDSTGPATVRRVAQNVLRLDYCDLKLGGALQEDLPVHAAMDMAFQHYGFRGNPWSGTQFKSEFLDRDHFPADSGFEATFHFEIEATAAAKVIEAIVERPMFWHVSVNGTAVSPRTDAWWLDTSFGVYSIGSHTRPGANSITLKAQPMSVHAEIQPVYILGDFGVAPQDRGFRIVPARELTMGGWKGQDLPFYSDAVGYRRTFRIEPGAGSYKVRLGKWLGTVAEVQVNGTSAGIIGWAPYELDVTKLLRGGRNEVEVLVYGSLKNLLGPHHAKFTPGLIGAWLWRTAPGHTPPGGQYDLIGYGLFEDFQLIQYNRP
jgi:hypothetical protein